MRKEQPLISIAVITYNSSKYVLETLESAKSQTYQNIELIISDDCSTDETVDICRCWIEKNKNCFVRTELITISQNTGISANVNRALRLMNGEWIKLIAGDDILFSRAIESHVEFISQKEHKDAAIVVSSVEIFKNNIENKLYVWPNFKFSNNLREQLRLQLMGNFIKAPGVFINREILIHKFGGFNEKYLMLEDDPLWILFLTNGYTFHFNNEVLVGYRIHDNSVSNGEIFTNEDAGNITTQFNFGDDLNRFKNEVSFPTMLKNRFYLEFFLCWIDFYIFKRKLYVGDTFFSIFYKIARKIIACFLKILSIYNWLIYIVLSKLKM